jgi:glycosyltransferase involved in cell wall biosynthesis
MNAFALKPPPRSRTESAEALSVTSQQNARCDVTVAICTRDRAKMLEAMLERLVTLRVPAGGIWEVLVVDNGSIDTTKEVVRAFDERLPIRYVLECGNGLGAARNAALRGARGRVVAFTDDDCFVHSEWLATLLAEFANDSSLAGIGGRVELFDSRDYPITIRTQREREEFSVQRMFSLIGGNMAFSRWAIDRVGAFDQQFGAGTRLRSAEDIDYLYRCLLQKLKVVYVPEVIVYHNHGRRTISQVQSLLQAYDTGRGALYAKYVLRGDREMLRQAYWYARSTILPNLIRFWQSERLANAARMLKHTFWGAVLYAVAPSGANTPLPRDLPSPDFAHSARHRWASAQTRAPQ